MNKYTFIIGFLFLLTISFRVTGQNAGGCTIIDSWHYSNVFAEARNYRIFLPSGYFSNPKKKYPVIYFLHGWSQRYFGSSDHYADFDKGDENKGDNIASYVSSHDVIVVKSDGYNRRVDEEYYVRPYNIGPVETFRQFPIYFPELINYIDSHYHTIANREHRAISGLSMGGFMTFWIAGKHPDLFSAAGSFCGSPEFEVGPKNFPVEYRHIDMYKNYAGMDVRLHYGDSDFIRSYHQDMNRVWGQLMDNYESKIYHAGHSTCGLGEMFESFLKTFAHPPSRPVQWNHFDVYPEFSVWDYKVSSDRIAPGFTMLENVDKNGFRCTVREFVPGGELMPFVNLSITTAALYEKNQLYVINDIDINNLKTIQKILRSDSSGRLKISINGSLHEIGINKQPAKPNICIASVEITNMKWATQDKVVSVSIKLLNKGLAAAKNIKATLTVGRSSTNVIQGKSQFGNIAVNEIKNSRLPFTFQVNSDTIEIVKFKLTTHDESNVERANFFEIPILKEVTEIKNFAIADGKIFTVAKAGTDNETVFLGNGNGDGIANPGESIVILVKDQDKYRRTNLSFSDKYVNPFGINNRMPDNWTSFDHVGASAKYLVPLIASDCPKNHSIEFLSEYWLPDYPLHIIKQGQIKIEVKGKDSTPSIISWVRIPGDNILTVKVYDGSRIKYVKATFIPKNALGKSFNVELKDDGLAGDTTESDNVFSKKVPEKKFGFYNVIIKATDSFGNKKVEEFSEGFLLH